MRIPVFILLIFLGANLMVAQENISDAIEKVVVTGTAESYMQFTPENYDPDQLWPALFVFDPSARGEVGIQPFIPAAREFGYIIVASNNCRNGQHQANFEIASRMMNQLLQSYSVDAKRMYVAGFSGGSRLASAIAVLSKQMQGVIGCGSGFSPNAAEQPAFEDFVYAGIVGTTDMNYAEMHTAHAWLDKFKVNNRLFVFDGDHQWPSAETIMRAFTWLELKAAEKGLTQINADRKDMLYSKDLSYAESLIETEPLMAYKELQSVLKGGAPAVQRTMADGSINKLRKDSELVATYAREAELLKEENKELNELSQRYLKDLEKPGKNALKWWKKRISQLKQEERVAGSELEKLMAIRLQKHIRAIAFESGFVDQNHKDSYEKALFSSQLCLMIDPENTYYNYLLVYTYANHGKTEMALQVLEEAFKQKKLDPATFKTYKLHTRLQSNERYTELLNSYLKQG